MFPEGSFSKMAEAYIDGMNEIGAAWLPSLH
jgi:hypothetical protein